MESEVFLSVIVPVYNAGKYLKTCLDSLVTQTFRDMEIILVDDGSTDSSAEVCDSCASEYKHVRVIHKKNGGPASAKREGLKIAQGQYIGFADSDDDMEPDYYEKLAEQAKEHDADIVTCGVQIEDTKRVIRDLVPAGVYRGDRLKKLQKSVIYDTVYETEGITPSAYTKLYRREVIKPFLQAVPDGLYTWEDLCYVYPPFFTASCVVITHHCGYHYRVHASSITHRTDVAQWIKILRSVAAARAAYERFSREVQIAFYTRCTYIFSSCLWTMCITDAKEHRGLKDAAWRLRRETQPELFRRMTKTALQEGNIKNRINKRFLSEIIRQHYVAAVLYCRLRTGTVVRFRLRGRQRSG